MDFSQILENSITWFAWAGSGFGVITVIALIFSWGFRFRLIGATVFTYLLSASAWAFSASYTPPLLVENAKYAPVVYDNGFDLVVAQASEDFPRESIEPTLLQIAANLKGGGRNGSEVHIRLRKLQDAGLGVSKLIVLGEVTRDINNGVTSEVEIYPQDESVQSVNETENNFIEPFIESNSSMNELELTLINPLDEDMQLEKDQSQQQFEGIPENNKIDEISNE